VVAFTALCAAVAGGFGYLITPLLLAPVMIALYELAVRFPGRTTRTYYVAVTALIVASEVIGGQTGYPWPLAVINPVLFLLLPVILAEFTRLRHDYVAAVTARAEYAEKNREEEARHRVAEERVRIARELHDVVAHHLALANAQAGTAAYLAGTSPDQAERILGELANTTSAALRELKATVGLLRHSDEQSSPLEPAPGLARLPELTAAFTSAGLDVEMVVAGEQQPLSPGVDLTAYRIVQEALTNVAKHATTKAAAVRLAYEQDRLTITVDNDAGPSSPHADGFGLIGMRERAESAGGRLRAGPRPAGGFTVHAELPVRR
jgi:signal transduction histidine kinase